MKQHHLNRPDVRVRKLPPKVSNEKQGVAVKCPFCAIPHPILPGAQSPCGTTLEVLAVQTVYRSTKHNGITCIKCHQIGGEMVRFNESFVHLVDCMPGTRLLTEIPEFSAFAKFIFKMPTPIRSAFEKRRGKIQYVKEIDSEGKETGKVLGYFFWRQ